MTKPSAPWLKKNKKPWPWVGKKIHRQHDKGRYTARERIDKLLDPGSFFEVGRFAHSDMPGMAEKTPGDSKIAGYGKIEGRQVAVTANDFTVMAATSSRIAGKRVPDQNLWSGQGPARDLSGGGRRCQDARYHGRQGPDLFRRRRIYLFY